MNAPNRGLLIGATWLIGLGLIFLIQGAMGWAWTEAWPMFLILAGIAAAIGAVLSGPHGRRTPWAFTWPFIWTLLGIVLLASATGTLGVDPGELIAQLWPWALVALGAWFVVGAFVTGHRRVESLALPLGAAQKADIRISFGGGDLSTHQSAPGMLVDGSFEGGVSHRLGDPGRVDLRQDLDAGIPWLERQVLWDVGLTAEVPLDLRLEGGAYRGTIDLTDLRLASLDLQTGASDTLIRLPRAAGFTNVKAQAGAAALTIEVPTGVAARIRTRVGLGSVQVDQVRFPKIGDIYQSIDYATATDRVDIDVQGGVGSLKIRSAR
jgi:hypothetical protein